MLRHSQGTWDISFCPGVRGKMSNLISILDRNGIHAQKVGQMWRMGNCPACGGSGKSDKVVIWHGARDGKASWYCHACGHSGDGVDLLQGLFGMEWRVAYEGLTGRHPPERAGKATGNPQASFPNRQQGTRRGKPFPRIGGKGDGQNRSYFDSKGRFCLAVIDSLWSGLQSDSGPFMGRYQVSP